MSSSGAHWQRQWLTCLSGALIGASILLFVFRSYEYGGYFAEDTYITFRFAKNLANGHGFVWNLGGEPVEGFTSPLHVVLLAIGLRIGWPLPFTTIVLNAVATVGLIVLYLLTVRREAGAVTLISSIILSVYLIDGRLAVHATSGMDTVLFMFVLALSYVASIRLIESPSWRAASALGLINLLCLLTRPDAAPYIVGQAVVIVGLSLHTYRRQRDRRLCLLAAQGYGLLFLLGTAYLIWKYLYFGYLLPNAFYIKSNEFFSLHGLSAVHRFGRSLFDRYGLIFIAGLFLIQYRGLGLWWKKSSSKAKAALLVVPPSVFLLYYTTVIHEVGYLSRFEYPVYIFFCLFLALLISLGRPMKGTLSKPALAAFTIGAVCLLGITYRLTGVYFPWFQIVEERFYRPIGEALESTHLGPKAVLVFDSAGVVPFVSEFSHIDPVGLTDNFLSGRQPITIWERERYIWDRRPDVYVGPEPPASPGSQRCADDPIIHSRYGQEVLLRPITAGPYFRSLGGQSRQDRCEVLHFRMRELRDRWVFLGEIPFPVSAPRGYTTFAYVRLGTPYFDQLVRALKPLVAAKPHQGVKIGRGGWGGGMAPSSHLYGFLRNEPNAYVIGDKDGFLHLQKTRGH